MKPNPNCELCNGTGTIYMDDTMEGYSFPPVTCECAKDE